MLFLVLLIPISGSALHPVRGLRYGQICCRCCGLQLWPPVLPLPATKSHHIDERVTFVLMHGLNGSK